jgi:putative glutathione S-transferase
MLGDKVTESDVRAFPTIVRFDAVYATLFKCQSRRVADMPNLNAWMRDFYLLPGVSETVDVDGYRTSYFGQLFPLNPGGIVPTGPTERDLGLGVDPARGSRAHSDLFHFK